MLLVLQNVHRSPPKEAYFVLQQLVGKVVKSYLPMVARSRTIVKAPSESAADGESIFNTHTSMFQMVKVVKRVV